MINRENWKRVREYLKYRREVERISKASARLEESWLTQLLRWADDCSFHNVVDIRPVFPEYIEVAGLSFNYSVHVIRAAHRFFIWLVRHRKYLITPAWLDTLKLLKMAEGEREHEAVTLEEIQAIARAPVETIGERRIRASAVFWWLSGIRVGAFVTLPLSAVDLENRQVRQWPKLGVKTKFQKHATTFLLDIPDLLDVVKAWDGEVREAGSKYWFAHLSPDTGEIAQVTNVGVYRGAIVRRDLKIWLEKVGLPYHSPHKFRHGHATYALKNAKDVPALKAVSQNLMHKNLGVTDGIYAILSGVDVKVQIANLGKVIAGSQNQEELIELLKQVLAQNAPKI